MKQQHTRDLYEYWQRIRGSRPAPERSDIEPADIRSLLGDTFILEVVSRDEYRYRLAGTRICAIYGREMKGKEFLSFWPGKDRDAVGTMLAAIVEDSAAAVIGVSGVSGHGRNLPMECLLLPVSQAGQGNCRILGSLVPMDDPYWIGIHPITTQSIASLRLIWPDERPFRLQRGNVAGGSDVFQGGAAIARSFRRRVGHLVVYDGGKTGEAQP
jgi:hypothetical protein